MNIHVEVCTKKLQSVNFIFQHDSATQDFVISLSRAPQQFYLFFRALRNESRGIRLCDIDRVVAEQLWVPAATRLQCCSIPTCPSVLHLHPDLYLFLYGGSAGRHLSVVDMVRHGGLRLAVSCRTLALVSVAVVRLSPLSRLTFLVCAGFRAFAFLRAHVRASSDTLLLLCVRC